MKRFTIPRDVFFGENASEHLKTIKGKKAFIVVGSERTVKDGTTDMIQKYLKEANIESQLFVGIENDPSIATVKKGVEKMNEFQPDVIIGLGGGSPIDAAKAMWIFYEHPNFTFEEAAIPFNLPEMRKKATFYAIATTSGTATEVTSFSVITDEKTGIKYPIADYNITPDVAILDTNLVKSMPKALVADTGMDALTHAIEAYTSVVANPFTDALAGKSIEMIGGNLVKSFNGENEARDNMHIASSLAGMSFSNAILGIVHSIAHKAGKIFNISHGMTNAICLSYVIQFNSKDATQQYSEIARILKLKGSTDSELITSLVDYIGEMRTKLNMPHSLKEYGVDEAFFLSKLDDLATTAVADPCTGTNPRKISTEEMKKLLLAIFNGEKITF